MFIDRKTVRDTVIGFVLCTVAAPLLVVGVALLYITEGHKR